VEGWKEERKGGNKDGRRKERKVRKDSGRGERRKKSGREEEVW
jgi:hypothetical protein